jgi:PEP-CTERM motif
MREQLKAPSAGAVHGQHRAKASTKFLVMLLFAATAAVTWQFARQRPIATVSPRSYPSPVSVQDAPENLTGPLSSRPVRPAYPYSIISGGVGSAEELRQIAERDPVVAQHFQGFDYRQAHLVTVSEKQLMYVAFRKGDKVYWTRKKVALHPGEILISDGKIVARTRCGNRVAVAPLGPPAIMDPLESDFNQPLFANDMVTNLPEPQTEAYASTIPSPPTEAGNSLRPGKRSKRLLPLFFVPFGGLPGGSASHAPLAVAPEPGTMLLLSSGLAGVYWKSRKARRK